MKKGLIFDLDGTLWDACAAITDSWNEYLKKNDSDLEIVLTEDDLRRACGLTMKAIGDLLFPQVEEKRRDRITAGCCEYEVEYLKKSGGAVYPGIRETMEALRKDWHLYIVSNCQVGYIEDYLDWSGQWDLIEDYENFGRTGKGKAENIRLLMERNGIEDAVYIGDTVMDQLSAGQAGIDFVWAAYGFGKAEEPKMQIASFEELPAVLASRV